MDALPTNTTSVVHYSPQLDKTNTAKNVSDDDILYITNYKCTRTYSSDHYGYVSDHPSKDLSDLALAVRDDTFSAPPGIIIRTYSSSDESIHSMESSQDEIVEASQYCGTATYSSDEYVCVSDHPSEDLSDLGQAVRDESFSPAPRGINRTYSSSDESSEWSGEVDHFEGMIKGLLISRKPGSTANDEQSPGRATQESFGGGEEWKQDEEDKGYASVEDNTDGSGVVESETTFKVTDRVPTSTAQWLFVMAWNGDNSSCEEDIGDIETIPSDGEVNDMDGLASDIEHGSINTVESIGESVENEKRSCETFGQEHDPIPISTAPVSTKGPAFLDIGATKDIDTAGTSTCPTDSDVFTSSDTHEVQSNAESSQSGVPKAGVVDKTCAIESDVTEKSFESDSDKLSHSHGISDIKSSSHKKRKVLKRFMKLFARCFCIE